LIHEWTPRGVRFVLASRVVGYRDAPVSGVTSTLTVLDFGSREIEVFVRQWARTFEAWLAGSESPEVVQKAAALERDLMEDVRSNSSVRRLAANPLMLTMLALLRRQVGRLPHRRIELYEKYVETLLENWIEARSFGARTEKVEHLDRHQAENVLIPLALWLQETKPSGTARRHEMHERLTGIYLEEEGLRREELSQLRRAEARAERFLHEMRQMAGLIVERGHDAYGFLHLTFQEHFAGRALAQLDGVRRWQIVQPHLHDPRWREPILLCAGRLGVVENRREQVTAFVRQMAGNEDPTEEHLRRNLLLALAIACDDVNLEGQLLDDLVATAAGIVPSGVCVLDRMLMEHLGQLVADGATDFETCFAAHLNCGDWRRRQDATEVLGRCLSVEGVRAVLLERLEHENGNIRQEAVRALARGVDDAEIRTTVLKRFNDDDEDVRQEALRTVASRLDDAEIRTARSEPPSSIDSTTTIPMSVVRLCRPWRLGLTTRRYEPQSSSDSTTTCGRSVRGYCRRWRLGSTTQRSEPPSSSVSTTATIMSVRRLCVRWRLGSTTRRSEPPYSSDSTTRMNISVRRLCVRWHLGSTTRRSEPLSSTDSTTSIMRSVWRLCGRWRLVSTTRRSEPPC
ncbi:MAG: hypothetical protein GY856_37630, partial [bacterium]|nr:hypothetical protein [bacterium]